MQLVPSLSLRARRWRAPFALLVCRLIVGACITPLLLAQDTPPLAEESAPEPENPPVHVAAPANSGDSLQRQTSSVQRQLGRARRNNDGFFVSSWFSDNPVNPLASAAGFTPPADCEPLDNTIAEAFMRESATREGISLDLVREVARRESGFYPCAVSPKGAMGMMQLMPDTAESLGVADPFDPRENIDGGVRLLRRLLDKYKGRPDLALAAYNAGEGAVDKANGVPDFAETREYVGAIMQKVFEAPRDRPSRNVPPGAGIRRNASPSLASPQSPAAIPTPSPEKQRTSPASLPIATPSGVSP